MVVNVGVRELRAQLSAWIDRVQAGDEVIVTERGRAVAKLTAVESRSKLDELVARGLVTPPSAPRRPIDRSTLPTMPPGVTLSDIVIEERRKARY